MANFKGVEDTLFIPLAGRVYASKNFKEFFYDEKALELEKYIPSESIKANTGEYFTMAAIARYYEFDNIVKRFIDKNGKSNVLCLGCGLETMYFRVNDKRARFYEIDMPDVIKQRKLVLGESENEILIGSNILDFKWMDEVKKDRPTLIMVCGVFQYLKDEEVKNLIHELQRQFKNSELAFDAMNKKGVNKANDYIHKTGNKEAMIYFYVDKPETFAKEAQVELLETVPFYKNSSRILKKKLSLSTKFLCYFGDKLGFTKIIHLKLN